MQLKRRQDANKTFGDSDTRVRAEDIGASLSSEDRCLSRRSELVARVTCASLPSDRGRRLSRATAALCLCFSWKEGGGARRFLVTSYRTISPHGQRTVAEGCFELYFSFLLFALISKLALYPPCIPKRTIDQGK